MISFLEGAVASKGPGTACLDVGGVGYALAMSQSAVAALPAVGERARVLCRLQVSDAGVALYGFASEDERALFDDLLQVSGIGPKTALAALSYYTAGQLLAAVAAQDVKAIAKVPGIGKKSASRIVLELKDRLPEGAGGDVVPAEAGEEPSSAALDAVREALRSMGFTADEVDFACKGADADLPEQQLLQQALKRLA